MTAGKPAPQLSIGLFEGWATVACGAIEWLGMASPILTQEEAQEEQGGLAGGLNPTWVFLDEWKQHYPDGAYCNDVMQSLQEEDLKHQARLREAAKTNSNPDAHKYACLRAAIIEFCPGRNGGLPSAKYLGQRMGRVKGRNIEGHILRGTSVDHTMYWSVVGLKESPKCPAGHEPEAAGIDRGLNSKSIPVNNEPEFDGDLYIPDDETGIEGIESLILINEVSEEINLVNGFFLSDMSLVDGGAPVQSPQSPHAENPRAGIESSQSPLEGIDGNNPVRGVAVSAIGYNDHIVVSLQSESGAEFTCHITRLYPALSRYLGQMGFASVPTVGEQLRVHNPRTLQWEPEADSARGLAFNVQVIAA